MYFEKIADRGKTYRRSINTFFTLSSVFYFSPQILLEIFFDTICRCLQTCASVAQRGSFMIYLLTAIGLSPGGSTHLHTNNIKNNTK